MNSLLGLSLACASQGFLVLEHGEHREGATPSDSGLRYGSLVEFEMAQTVDAEVLEDDGVASDGDEHASNEVAA